MKSNHKQNSQLKALSIGIPLDWSLEELKQNALVLFSNVDKHIKEGEIPILLCNYKDVYYNKYIFKELSFSEGSVTASELKKFKLKKGDVIITKDSEDRKDIAVPTYVIEDIPNLVCGYHLAIIRPDKNKLDGIFLSNLFQFTVVNHHFQRLANGITRFGLSTDTIKKSLIPVPPLDEQQRIAEILSTWDLAISTCENIIQQLKLRNKGLADQLLTGKKRLKGFSGEWKEMRAGDVTEKFTKRNKNLTDAKVYSVTNHSGFILQTDHFSKGVAGEDLTSYKIISKGEFAYNPARINVGSIAYFDREEGVISSLYVCFRTNRKVLDQFLSYWIKLEKTNFDFGRFGEGGVRIYLWYDLFSKIKILLPPIEEQKAIADVLGNADKELKLYICKLNNLKDQKKGIMQKLLTGKIRIDYKPKA